ncbi:MAG: hypothetical protein ACP5UL_05120, partial [Thermoplasmata archaeon]
IKVLSPNVLPEEQINGEGEVRIRRQISALYFGIMNYWADIQFYKHNINPLSLYKGHGSPNLQDANIAKDLKKKNPDDFIHADL